MFVNLIKNFNYLLTSYYPEMVKKSEYQLNHTAVFTMYEQIV